MRTGIAFSAVPKFRSGVTSTVCMSGIASFAGSVIMLNTFGFAGLAVTAGATIVSTSALGITSSRKRAKLQQKAINDVLADVMYSEVRLSLEQTRKLLSGERLEFDHVTGETLEISYLPNSGEPTEKPEKEEPYTGMINIEVVRNPLDGVASFDSVLLSLSNQKTPEVLNARQRGIVKNHLDNKPPLKATETPKFIGPEAWVQEAKRARSKAVKG